MLEPRTLRCVRFLASLVVGMQWESAEARRQGVVDLVEAAVINLQLEHGLELTRAMVGGWLGVDA